MLKASLVKGERIIKKLAFIRYFSTCVSSMGSEQEEDGGSDWEDCDDEEEDDKCRKMAAASMVVNVGSFHEKAECQGLAHLCEHMVSMGSSKYPNENELEQLLSRNSGDSNAFTEAEYTNYHFEVAPDKFQEALDIWANYFIDPLMREESIEREGLGRSSLFSVSSRNTSSNAFSIQEKLLQCTLNSK